MTYRAVGAALGIGGGAVGRLWPARTAFETELRKSLLELGSPPPGSSSWIEAVAFGRRGSELDTTPIPQPLEAQALGALAAQHRHAMFPLLWFGQFHDHPTLAVRSRLLDDYLRGVAAVHAIRAAGMSVAGASTIPESSVIAVAAARGAACLGRSGVPVAQPALAEICAMLGGDRAVELRTASAGSPGDRPSPARAQALQAAVELACDFGPSSALTVVTARSIASELHLAVGQIYRSWEAMDEVREAIVALGVGEIVTRFGDDLARRGPVAAIRRFGLDPLGPTLLIEDQRSTTGGGGLRRLLGVIAGSGDRFGPMGEVAGWAECLTAIVVGSAFSAEGGSDSPRDLVIRALTFSA